MGGEVMFSEFKKLKKITGYFSWGSIGPQWRSF
jgi:hypothetical protein